jgi:amino acid adenylation domain-containing protein
VADGASEVTYRDLDAAGNRYAQLLLDRGGRGTARVALLLPDDAGLFAATLGVLKAGKAAVVLNVGDPPARLAQIIDDAEPQLVLTDPDHAGLMRAAGSARTDLVVLDDQADQWPEDPPEVIVDPGEIAFLMYTSGSVGRPKGVIHTHLSWLHAMGRLSNAADLVAGDRWPMVVSTNTSWGSTMLWVALLNGAAICPCLIAERGLGGLEVWAAETQLTCLTAPPSVFRHLFRTMAAPIPSVRTVRLAGETVLRADIEACREFFNPDCVVACVYGSTEAGTLAQTKISGRDPLPLGPVPMGSAIDWVELLMLDDDGKEVAPGEIGEITVRCDHLPPGYWRDEELTAERFSYREGRRINRTGDLGRMSAEGILTVLGRRDLQVKVRGNRIALNEVEGAIIALPGVTGATVCATRTASGDNKLTAFVTTSPGASLSVDGVRAALRSRLPQREMPSAIVFVESFPFNVQGKVDREQLARSVQFAAASDADADDGAAGSVDATLALIFARAFDVEQVGVDQDFFALGGDSLSAHVIAAGVHELFGVQLDLLAILDNPSVARLALVIESLLAGESDQQPPLERVASDAPLPLSFAQERTWRYSQTPEQSAGYTDAFGMLLSGALDLEAFRRAVDHLVARHEALRTSFSERNGRPVQVIHPAAPFEMELIDLAGVEDGERRAKEMLVELASIPFELARGPLLRLRLVRTTSDRHYLLWVDHHIISDAWSVKLFFEELGLIYKAFQDHEPAPIPDRLPFRCADFAVWERQRLDPSGSYYQAELAWWRETLHDAPALELPFARDTSAPDTDSSDGVIHWGLAPETTEALSQLARRATATYYMVRLALLAAHLALETGSRDLLLGTYVTGRRLVEAQAMFGYFANTVSLRIHVDPALSFRELLAHVRARVIETSQHSDLPYEELCDQLRAQGIEPPEIRLIFNPFVSPAIRIPGLEITPMRRTYATMPWGFSFNPNQHREANECEVSFDARIHDPDGVRRFLARFRRLADEVCAQPDRGLDSLATDPYRRSEHKRRTVGAVERRDSARNH